MKPINGGILAALALALLVSAGCESVALVGRDPLPLEPAEVVAQVERLDTRLSEVHLRPNNGPTRVVGYHAGTRVLRAGRDYPVTDLRSGDVVAMHLQQDPQGRFYTDLLNVRQGIQEREVSQPRATIQRLDGTVEQVDVPRGSFGIREPSGARVTVALPYNARRSDIDRLHRLRNGDAIVLEGRFINRDLFELEAFL